MHILCALGVIPSLEAREGGVRGLGGVVLSPSIGLCVGDPERMKEGKGGSLQGQHRIRFWREQVGLGAYFA